MTRTERARLQKQREDLLSRLAELDRQLEESHEWSQNKPLPQSKRVRRGQRPLRDVCLDMLSDCGSMLYSQTIAQACRAYFGRDVPPTRFGSLSNDEEKAFANGRPRPVFLCHGLTYDRGEAMKRVWARSDWPLEERIVGPISGRIVFLRFAEWISRLAEEAAGSSSPAARPERLMYMAADCARDLGFRVRKGDRDFAQWRQAAREELDRKFGEDLEHRREAANRLGGRLNDVERLFGAREGLTVLPGSAGEWSRDDAGCQDYATEEDAGDPRDGVGGAGTTVAGHMDDDLYDTTRAGKYLGGELRPISRCTLENWRVNDRGPKYIKVGRFVRYRKSDLDEYLTGELHVPPERRR